MERLFPEALLTCIRDGRLPVADEISFIAEKIASEALRHSEIIKTTNALQNAAYAALAGTAERPMVQAALYSGRE